MGETSGQIESQIRTSREELGANLSELQQKVKDVADWRQQFQKSPGTFLAVAAGGGLLLALLTNGRRAPAAAPAPTVAAPSPGREKPPSEWNRAFGDIKAALIGTAAVHAKDILSKWVPGFEQQAAEPQAAEAKNPPPPTSPEGTALPH